MTPKEFIKEAQKIQTDKGDKSLLAIPPYQKAIETWNDSDDEYEMLYAHYQIMWINSHHNPQQAVLYAEKCLELLQSTIRAGAIGHFTEMGQFHEEVIRYATNCIGWNTFSQTDDKARLEELVELVSMGCQYADDPKYFYIFDTKARILLKLGRKEEAYNIVRSCLKKDKDFGDFNDIIRENDYRSWKDNFEAGIVLQLSDEERNFLKKTERITEKIKQRIIADGKNKKDITETILQKEIITLGEAKEKYKISNYHGKDDSVLLIKGDVYVKGSLDNAWFNNQLMGMSWTNTLYGMIIDGSLTVDGDVIDDEYLELFVTQNLTCDYVFSYNGTIEITGDANIKYGIYGEYNDGSLTVYGKVNTPYLIASDHSMPREAEGDFIYIEGGNGTDRESIAIGESKGSGWGWGWNYYENSPKLLAPALWNEEDEFSADIFFAMVRKGENPFVNQK